MSLKLTSSWGVLASAVFGLSGLLSYAQLGGGAGHGRSIEFSAPKGKEVRTNYNQFPAQQKALKKLEDELNGSVGTFSSKGSLDPAMPAPMFRPAPMPVYQDRRTQELMERRKNWAFAQPEDWALGTAGDNFFNSPIHDAMAEPGKSGSSTDLVLENLLLQQGGQKPTADRQEDPAAFRKSAREQDALDNPNLPNGIRENAQSLRKYLDQAGGDSLSGLAPIRGGFSDLAVPDDKRLSPTDPQARKSPVDQYRQMIEGNVQTPLSPLKDLRQLEPTRKLISANGLEGLASSTRQESLGGTPAALDAVVHPAALPDLNQKVLRQWDPLYTPPPPEPAKSGPISVPMAEVPKRKF